MPPTIHETVRSRRRTLALQITEEGRLVVRAPRHVSDSEIRRFVREKSAWIDRMAARAAERARTAPPPLSPEEEKSLKVLARDAFIERACRYAARMGPGGNLSFNWRLIRAPLDVLDYVVVHELAHLVEPNHSPRFWSKVAEYCPAFRDAKLWLRRNRL